MKAVKSFLLFICLLAFATSVVAVDLSTYSHVSTISVDCEEYEGFVRFDLPDEYATTGAMKSYMEVDHSIDIGRSGVRYLSQQNWYVNEIDGYDVANIENMYDSNYNSVFISQSEDLTVLELENPNIEQVSKITIDIKDSSLDSIVLKKGSQVIPFTLVKNTFHYELLLNNEISARDLTLELSYGGILKIKDLKLLTKKEDVSSSFGYFYVDNTCDNEYLFYFGDLGENTASRGSRSLPVVFQTHVSTSQNLDYEPDFDSDGIENHIDNCMTVANTDQKDINYNKRGDACEDSDNDGVVNADDNCPEKSNRNQADDDDDLIGNACDAEDDRFFEKNNILVYAFAALVGMIFFGLAFHMMKTK